MNFSQAEQVRASEIEDKLRTENGLLKKEVERSDKLIEGKKEEVQTYFDSWKTPFVKTCILVNVYQTVLQSFFT